MPKEVFGPDHVFLPRRALLTYEETARVVRILAARGVEKVRITGGEPLVRRDLPRLIEQVAAVEGIRDVCLTTNGALLATHARRLGDAGLRRVTVSLDSLHDEVFREMNDVGVPVAKVLEGIAAASDAGLGPVKINAVVQRGRNDHTIVDLARHFHGTGHILRFIEYMDVGNSNGWKMDDVVPASEIVRRIHEALPLEPTEANYPGEVARRWRYRDGGGEIGVISSVTRPFCAACTRLRLSPDGKLFTCLFAAAGHDLRSILRAGASDDELAAAMDAIWTGRQDRYSELRSSRTRNLPKVEMSFIGG